MSDTTYQTIIISHIEQKIGKGKTSRFNGFEKNIIKIDDKHVILIKYCSNQSKPYFQFTDKEVADLLAINKTFPSQTFVIFTTGDKISCSVNLKELNEICILTSQQRMVFIEDITYGGYLIRGQFGEKRLNKNQYLSFLTT